jgi:hypothetical protein
MEKLRGEGSMEQLSKGHGAVIMGSNDIKEGKALTWREPSLKTIRKRQRVALFVHQYGGPLLS